MQVVNYTEFRNNLAKYLKMVNEIEEIVVISRVKNRNVVVMSWDEYHSILKKLQLASSRASEGRL